MSDSMDVINRRKREQFIIRLHDLIVTDGDGDYLHGVESQLSERDGIQLIKYAFQLLNESTTGIDARAMLQEFYDLSQTNANAEYYAWGKRAIKFAEWDYSHGGMRAVESKSPASPDKTVE